MPGRPGPPININREDHMPNLRRFLPPIDTPRYHILLGAIAILILGPLGGITAGYMNFSLGFFVGGQVLAGILGSVVTYAYGAEGKHGANYMQTMAASVASLSGMAVLIQAMTWLGLPEPPVWQLVLYFLCIGMFGVGVGMLYTPILVDRMRLSFPSGFAVANILRALTDIRILKTSIAKLGGGTAAGFVGGLAATLIAPVAATSFSSSTVGAGMIVGVRIGLPAVFIGAIGLGLTPWLRSHGWLGPEDPFRKIGFIAALGMILGAAVVDMSLLAVAARRTFKESKGQKAPRPRTGSGPTPGSSGSGSPSGRWPSSSRPRSSSNFRSLSSWWRSGWSSSSSWSTGSRSESRTATQFRAPS
jgi:hypothetical protein